MYSTNHVTRLRIGSSALPRETSRRGLIESSLGQLPLAFIVESRLIVVYSTEWIIRKIILPMSDVRSSIFSDYRSNTCLSNKNVFAGRNTPVTDAVKNTPHPRPVTTINTYMYTRIHVKYRVIDVRILFPTTLSGPNRMWYKIEDRFWFSKIHLRWIKKNPHPNAGSTRSLLLFGFCI